MLALLLEQPQGRTVPLPRPHPLTCSIHPFLAPGMRGLGPSRGSSVSHIWSRSNLGSGSSGRPALLLLHRGGGIEP